MQILETNPKYYRVQLPSGQVLTIARTAGTDALVQSKAGLAGGGVIAPEFLPPEPDPFEQALGTAETPLIREVPAEMASQPVVGGGVPPNPKLDVLKKVAEPWMQPYGLGDVLFGPVPKIAASVGALAGDPAVRQELGGAAQAAKGAAQQVKGSVVVGAADDQPAGEPAPAVQEPGPELDQDLARLMEPSWLPGEQGAAGPTAADVSELNRATRDLAETQAREQEALAAHYESMRLPEQPPNQPVNPGQFYENIGKMFGAQNPRSARIIGGIASGLMVGLGEIGAALSHRQNVAAGIIQNAISESIASQQNAQALTRQQWLDQTAYATAVSNKKIGEIAAKAKAPEIRAQAAVLIAKNNLAYLGARVKDGSISPQDGKALIKLETSRADDVAYMTTSGTVAAGPGSAIREKLGGVPIVGDMIGPPPKDTEALAKRDASNASFAAAMSPDDKSPMTIKEAWATYPNAMFAPGDSAETMQAKAKTRATLRRSREAIHGASIRGVDPKGAGTVTPNARPN